MPWTILLAAAASAVLGFGLGWPLGFIAAAGCLLLPFAVVQVMLLLFPPRVLRPPPAREPLRVVAVRLDAPPGGLPGPSQPAISEREP